MLFLLTLIMLAAPFEGAAQTKSLALKDSLRVQHGVYPFHRDESAWQSWNLFMLVQSANSGDPSAQHELGLRYLLGDGFEADTAKAALWIQKAALQNVYPARYNYGILLNNGWGVPWNPFEAYRQFRYAADHGMVEAEYVVGIYLTDNLVVPRDYTEAYRWLKMAADRDFQPAREVLMEFHRRGIDKNISYARDADSSARKAPAVPQLSQSASGLEPVFLDMDNDAPVKVDDQMLLRDAVREGVLSQGTAAQFDSTGVRSRPEAVDSLRRAAEAGSPEALTLLGRWYERGIGITKDRVAAAAAYLRAMHLDGLWAPRLLWDVVHRENFFKELHTRIDKGDAEALFTWAQLVAVEFDHQITEEQAFDFLRKSADQRYLPAMIELGMCYYNGRWTRADKDEARNMFQAAEKAGSAEGHVRLVMMKLAADGKGISDTAAIGVLRSAEAAGSVLAQSMLGYCYESGFGTPVNIPEAIREYREASGRGSKTAYAALRRMYDDLRPRDAEFQIRNK